MFLGVYFVCFCFILHIFCIVVSTVGRPDVIEALSLGPIFLTKIAYMHAVTHLSANPRIP